MKIAKKYIYMILSGISLLLLSACAAEIGSDEWCADLKEKPKADWTANEAADFTKHCILK
jgi:hypothetical protein